MYSRACGDDCDECVLIHTLRLRAFVDQCIHPVRSGETAKKDKIRDITRKMEYKSWNQTYIYLRHMHATHSLGRPRS